MAETRTLALNGPLTIASAAGRLDLSEWPSAGGTLTLDLAGIDDADSAGVSVMLHWLREAQRRKVSLRFTHIPTALTQLAKLYDVADWLHEKPS
ncbi:hypothetical protein JHS3_29210 [Jeongeupia sp. HS-3]|uniref:STAS domain-containing protein n=1 Tax=Jeongeupia sp. HS-3 TaxID=1009682 RepID=UPI0018A6587D|nr:STAS domain-containing protein [Jeongeupia sp. HS-3]BCL77185.1 hypothetical protein JHS3_29210 [Jeongeupia sp. HS-3]